VSDLIAIVVIGPPLLVVLGFLVLRAWRQADQAMSVRRSHGWTPADSSFELEEGDTQDGCVAVGLRYSYSAGGETFTGTYFLPALFDDPAEATQAGKEWEGKWIVVRYDPEHPQRSIFLPIDGAPGLSRIPTGLTTEPYIQGLTFT
jgi:hypothetical protein